MPGAISGLGSCSSGRKRIHSEDRKNLMSERPTHEIVRLTWEQLAARRYINMMHKWRGKG
ncbi:conserved hypothetical protein [Ricinus communis]|uniref:Uncharacterized protein n=1 Tax=Ricinus communis TaxID=3988 RepID=B9S9C6_RICCO|nr:conserved hypothetical protein [Ricinus communis]